MIIKKTDELIQVEELFANFNSDVASLEETLGEATRTLLSLKVQYEEAERRSAKLDGRIAQAKEDQAKLTAVITQANTAWDKQVDVLKEKRLNDIQDARIEWYKKGYKTAYDEVKGTPKSKKPRPVAESIIIARAKKLLKKETDELKKSPPEKTV